MNVACSIGQVFLEDVIRWHLMLKERTSATPVVDARERIPALDSHQAAFQTPAGSTDPENQMASRNRGMKDNWTYLPNLRCGRTVRYTKIKGPQRNRNTELITKERKDNTDWTQHIFILFCAQFIIFHIQLKLLSYCSYWWLTIQFWKLNFVWVCSMLVFRPGLHERFPRILITGPNCELKLKPNINACNLIRQRGVTV